MTSHTITYHHISSHHAVPHKCHVKSRHIRSDYIGYHTTLHYSLLHSIMLPYSILHYATWQRITYIDSMYMIYTHRGITAILKRTTYMLYHIVQYRIMNYALPCTMIQHCVLYFTLHCFTYVMCITHMTCILYMICTHHIIHACDTLHTTHHTVRFIREHSLAS